MNSKRLLLAVNVLLTGLILWTGYTLVMSWPSKESPVHIVVERELEQKGGSPKSMGKGRRISDYQALLQQDVFRTTRQKGSQAVPAQVIEEKPVEVTKLNLKLKGIVIRSGKDSFAAITDGGTRKENIYYLNDKIQNARIAKILQDQVILEVNNRQEALLLFAQSEEKERRGVTKQVAPIQARRPVVVNGPPRPSPERSVLGAGVASRLPAMIRQRRR